MRCVLAAVQCSLPPPPPCRYCHFPMKGSSCWERGKKDTAGSTTVSYNAIYRPCKSLCTPALLARYRPSRCTEYTDLLLQPTDSQPLVKPMVAGAYNFEMNL